MQDYWSTSKKFGSKQQDKKHLTSQSGNGTKAISNASGLQARGKGDDYDL
jgi:hypothetical protein